MRYLFSLLLRDLPWTAAKITKHNGDVLRRAEEVRIYAWNHKTGQYPPSRKFILEEKELQ